MTKQAINLYGLLLTDDDFYSVDAADSDSIDNFLHTNNATRVFSFEGECWVMGADGVEARMPDDYMEITDPAFFFIIPLSQQPSVYANTSYSDPTQVVEEMTDKIIDYFREQTLLLNHP